MAEYIVAYMVPVFQGVGSCECASHPTFSTKCASETRKLKFRDKKCVNYVSWQKCWLKLSFQMKVPQKRAFVPQRETLVPQSEAHLSQREAIVPQKDAHIPDRALVPHKRGTCISEWGIYALKKSISHWINQICASLNVLCFGSWIPGSNTFWHPCM